MEFELDVEKLRAVAAARGDVSGYAIAQRTGLDETTVSRLLRRKVRPGVKTLLILRKAYGARVDDYIRECAV